MDSMAARIEQVTQENSRLHSELRRSLETQIQAATESGSLRLKSSGGADALDALKQQLEMVTRDRDSYQELLKKTSHELELVQRSDQVSSPPPIYNYVLDSFHVPMIGQDKETVGV